MKNRIILILSAMILGILIVLVVYLNKWVGGAGLNSGPGNVTGSVTILKDMQSVDFNGLTMEFPGNWKVVKEELKLSANAPLEQEDREKVSDVEANSNSEIIQTLSPRVEILQLQKGENRDLSGKVDNFGHKIQMNYCGDFPLCPDYILLLETAGEKFDVSVYNYDTGSQNEKAAVDEIISSIK